MHDLIKACSTATMLENTCSYFKYVILIDIRNVCFNVSHSSLMILLLNDGNRGRRENEGGFIV